MPLPSAGSDSAKFGAGVNSAVAVVVFVHSAPVTVFREHLTDAVFSLGSTLAAT